MLSYQGRSEKVLEEAGILKPKGWGIDKTSRLSRNKLGSLNRWTITFSSLSILFSVVGSFIVRKILKEGEELDRQLNLLGQRQPDPPDKGQPAPPGRANLPPPEEATPVGVSGVKAVTASSQIVK